MSLAAGILGFTVMTVYWPGLSGAAVAPRWAMIAVAMVLVLTGPRIRMTGTHALGLVFLAWAVLTMIWAAYPLDGLDTLGRMALLAGVFCLGSQLDDVKPAMIGAALGLTISSAVAIAQLYGVYIIETQGPAGLFWNKNYLAEAAALVLIYVVAKRMWWLVPGLLPAVYLPQARGAWLALAVAGVLLLWRRSRAAAIGGTAVAIVLMGYAILSVSFASGNERIAIWRDTFEHLSLFGHGIGSFVETFPQIAHHFVIANSRPAYAHNEFLGAAFETGAVGLALLVAFIASLLRGPLTAERLVLIGIMVEACFAFPFQMPATAFLGLLVAGRAAADLYPLRDALAGGRMALHARLFGRSRYTGGVQPS